MGTEVAKLLEAEADAVAGSGSAAIAPEAMKQVRAVSRDSRRIIVIPSGLSIGLERCCTSQVSELVVFSTSVTKPFGLVTT
ncbi:MAG: hypothetical protein ACPGPS_20885, partial [Rubripirellula sp.]